MIFAVDLSISFMAHVVTFLYLNYVVAQYIDYGLSGTEPHLEICKMEVEVDGKLFPECISKDK